MGELAQRLKAAQPKPETMELEQYLERVLRDPRISRSAHARMWDAIRRKGVTGEGEKRRWGFFEAEIFGIDSAINQIADYFASAAQGMDIRRRILLLLGPPGAAKSTIVHLLKRGYEAYARTDEGAMYGIVGCPHHEEPLHALPPDLREEFRQAGAFVEGDLCPYCRTVLDEELGGDITRLRVERVYPDEARRIAIGTFAPGDHLSQEMSDLVGSMDISKLPKYGSESDARAYRFDGAINVASRGILELVELFKIRQDLAFSLLTLAQERMVKAGRFELFYVDEILVAHTNEAEFERFAADRKNEAIQNRLFVVRVPYNLSLPEEEKIYRRMLVGADLSVHLAPRTLETAGSWALLTRYQPTDKYPPEAKLDLYAGEYRGQWTEANAREARLLSPRDGMQGVSPRQILNALSMGAARKSVACLNPIDALTVLKDTLPSHISSTDPQELEKWIGVARERYDKEIKEDVERAFVHGFDEAAQNLLRAYLDNAEASLEKTKVRDPITGEDVDPDERLLSDIEGAVGITPAGSEAFRREVLAKAGSLLRRGESLRWDSHPKLKEAIQKRLFADVANLIKITTSAVRPDPEQQKVIDRAIEALRSEGYCEHCAKAALEYVGRLIRR